MLNQLKNGAVQVSPRFWFKAIMAVTVVGSAVFLVQTIQVGAAVYSVARAPNGVHAYSGAGPTFDFVSSIPNGSQIDISCQDYGAATRMGTNIWDQLSDGSWISDYYATTPNFNEFSPGLMRCGSSSTGGGNSREFKAFSWTASQIGQAWQRGGLPWAWWCDRFVANAFGMTNSNYNTAIDHYQDLANRGLMHVGDTYAPFGSLVFYNTAGGGHVAYSYGNGNIITTPARNGDPVYRTTIDHFPAYLGWAYANPDWPGR